MISVVEQSSGLTYRNFTTFNNTVVPNYAYRVAATYVTGTHAIKTGWNDTFGYLNALNYGFNPVSYTFLNGAPTSLTSIVHMLYWEENHDWRQRVLMLTTGAIRYDWFKSSFPEQPLGTARSSALPQHHVRGAGRHQLEGHLLPQRIRLRRRGAETALYSGEQMPARPDAERPRDGLESILTRDHDGAFVDG
jgi:hypothetical protein